MPGRYSTSRAIPWPEAERLRMKARRRCRRRQRRHNRRTGRDAG